MYSNARVRLLLSTATGLLSAFCILQPPAFAQSWSSILPKAGIGCFKRDYDAAHLARNPGQTVSSTRTVITHSNAASKGDYPGTWFKLVIAYATRAPAGGKSAEEIWELANCDAGPEGSETPIACMASCYGNSPEFRIAIAGPDSIRIDLSGPQSPFCHSDRALEGKDNRIFLLNRADPSKCGLTGRNTRR